MKNEAQNAAMQIFSKYVVKCGNEYCTNQGIVRAGSQVLLVSAFRQYKEVSIHIEDLTSDADRLNGFEWKGKVSLELGGPYRLFYNHVWSEWSQSNSNDVITITAGVQKKKGDQWDAIFDGERWGAMSFNENDLHPITCADVPK